MAWGAALAAMGIGGNSDDGGRRCGCMELTHIEVMEERFVRSNERARVEGRGGLEYGEYNVKGDLRAAMDVGKLWRLRMEGG